MNPNARPNAVQDRPALVLIIDHQEWSSRALDSFLAPAGYAVLRAYNAEQGIERAAAASPDVIIVAARLPDLDGIELCRLLAADPGIGPATPILLTITDPLPPELRIACFHAGVWELVPLPLDADELLAKLPNWIRSRRELDRVRDASLLDDRIGVYNARGLLARVNELAAEAARYRKPLSCVVFTVHGEAAGATINMPTAVLAAMRDVLRVTVRTCDAIGCLSPDKFAVLAPATDATGAFRLAQRALHNFDGRVASGDIAPLHVEAGYFGVADFRDAALDPAELLARAAIATRRPTARDPREPRIRSYDDGSHLN